MRGVLERHWPHHLLPQGHARPRRLADGLVRRWRRAHDGDAARSAPGRLGPLPRRGPQPRRHDPQPGDGPIGRRRLAGVHQERLVRRLSLRRGGRARGHPREEVHGMKRWLQQGGVVALVYLSVATVFYNVFGVRAPLVYTLAAVFIGIAASELWPEARPVS